MILGSAILLLVQKATGDALVSFGGLVVPFEEDWWRYLTAPFAYVDVGYLFVVALALAIFATGVERRLGTVPTAVLLIACGALGMLAAGAVADPGTIAVIAGGNGMALGAVAAWFVIRRAEVRGAIGEDYDVIGVAVCAVVLILLPLFAPTADLVAGLAGGAVGALAGLGPGHGTAHPSAADQQAAPRDLGWRLGARRERSSKPRSSGCWTRSGSPRPSGSSPRRRRSCRRCWRRRWPRAAGSASRTRTRRSRPRPLPDPDERVAAVRALLAEEARMGMMVGVAVGWALKEELDTTTGPNTADPGGES